MEAAVLPADAISTSSADHKDTRYVASGLHLACGTSLRVNKLTAPRIQHKLGRPALSQILHVPPAWAPST